MNMAFSDITKYIKEKNIRVLDENGNSIYVCPSAMLNKETRRLNRILGLHKLNK